MNLPTDRQRYVPSGALNPAPFLVLALLAGVVALLAGYVLYLSTPLTFTGGVFGPFLAGLPVAGFLVIAVRVGKCRNPPVAAVLGVLTGLLVFFGAFQFGLAAARGNDHFFRLDLLPAWLDEHVRDSQRWDGNRAGANGPAHPATLAIRWGVLALGCLLGCSLPAGIGWITAAEPFSEAHGRWFKAWPVRVARGWGAAVAVEIFTRRDALRDAIKRIPPGGKVDQSEGFARLTIEYLPGEADEPVYLSLTVQINEKGKTWPQTVFRRWQLTAEEAAVLAEAVPVPNAAFGPRREGALPGDRVATAIGARVLSLPDQDAGHILSSGNLWMATAVGFLPLILGIGAATTAGVVAYHRADDLDAVEQGCVIAAGVAALVASLAWLALYADLLPARVLLAQARRHISHRPDAFVYPDDPDAFFVQRIPRQNWGRVMLENADELGFLRLDAARGVILFEGDRERWLIPRESVVSCELDGFDIGPADPNVGPAFWLVVLRVSADGRVWEAPLSVRFVTLAKATPSTRRREAELLQARIRRVLGSEKGE